MQGRITEWRFSTERYEEALGIVDAALELKPESPVEWSIGVLCYQPGRNEEALKLNRALVLDPESPKILPVWV